MAILDGVKNAVSSQVAARANRTIRSGLTKVAGNLLGINTQFDGPQLGQHQDRAPRYRQNRFDTKSLSYPLDVETDDRQGHYIYFIVNQHNQAELEVQEKAQADAFNSKLLQLDSVSKGGNIFHTSHAQHVNSRDNRSKLEKTQQSVGNLAIENYDPSVFNSILDETAGGQFGISPGDVKKSINPHKNSSSLRLRNMVSTTAVAHIALYMPPSVQVNYGADYQDTEIGVFADLGAQAIAAFKESADYRKTVESMVETGSVGFKKALLATLDTVAPGSKAIAQIMSGKAITPKMELMFNGIGRRQFSYEFTFMPRSANEAASVQDIVKEFKVNMAANFTSNNEGVTSFREMYLPNTFSIQYQYMGQPNDNLHKISECVLESADVTYGGERYQTHAGGVPQTTKLALKFKELEIITKDLVEQGY